MMDINEFERYKREYIQQIAMNFQMYELCQNINNIHITSNLDCSDVQMTDVNEIKN
jgi:hypothetical protein